MRFLHDHNLKDHWKDARLGACLLGLLALPLLAGCGGGGGGGNGNSGGGTPGTTAGTGGTNNGPVQPTLTVSTTTATGLTASLTESSGTVAVGGSLTYTLTLTNNTAAAVAIHATGSPPTTPSAVLTVKNAAGAVTFQPVPGPPPIYNGSLAPGQSISTTQVATGFAAAGVYTATATFSDDTSAAVNVGPLTVTAQ